MWVLHTNFINCSELVCEVPIMNFSKNSSPWLPLQILKTKVNIIENYGS
jgi:hypothetical protein